MGNIPAVTQMVSSLFTSPKNGDDIAANTDFVISVQMINFAPGTFTNPQSTYYSAPQDLDGAGNIIGHTHVTVQDLGGDANPTAPLNPQEFVFFKGINNDGNGQGLLSADVPGGLPAGNYRLCSMASSANHQPVIMPVAQRGAQDDCVRFTVSDGGNNGGNNDDDANNGGNNDDANNGDDAGNDGGNNGDNAGNDDANNGGNNNGGANNGGVNNGDNAGGNDDANNGGNNNGGNNDGGAGNGGNDDANNGGNGGGNGGGAGGASAATALGGIAAPQVEQGNDPNRPFVVAGNSFTDENNAIGRACDIQRNSCLDAVNRGQATGFAVTGCDAQLSACVAELSG